MLGYRDSDAGFAVGRRPRVKTREARAWLQRVLTRLVQGTRDNTTRTPERLETMPTHSFTHTHPYPNFSPPLCSMYFPSYPAHPMLTYECTATVTYFVMTELSQPGRGGCVHAARMPAVDQMKHVEPAFVHLSVSAQRSYHSMCRCRCGAARPALAVAGRQAMRGGLSESMG